MTCYNIIGRIDKADHDVTLHATCTGASASVSWQRGGRHNLVPTAWAAAGGQALHQVGERPLLVMTIVHVGIAAAAAVQQHRWQCP